MATSKETDKGTDITKCPICLEKYTIPKYLPCLHTFCENCILTYTSKTFEKETKRVINCPICRSEALLQEENADVEGWAKSLPLNILVVSLIERDKLERPEKKCMICERIDIQSDAQFVCLECSDLLCLNCEKFHRAHRSSTNHTTKRIEGVCLDELPISFLSRNKCNTHTNKELELFCVDHEEPCCPMCVSIHHRKCEKVLAIEDAAKDFACEKKVQELKKELAGVETDIDTLLSDRKTCNQELVNQYETGKKELEKMFTELIDKVSELKTQRESELHKAFDQSSDKIDTLVTIFTCLKKNIENEKGILDTSVTKAAPAQAMIEMQRVRKLLSEHKKRLENIIPDMKNFTLSVKNNDVSELMDSVNQISEVKIDENLSQVMLCSTCIKEPFIFNRFTQLSLDWNVNSNKDAICFKTSMDIKLFGLMTFVCMDEKSPVSVTAWVKDNTTELIKVAVTIDSTEHKEKKCNMMFPRPVKIKANKIYHVVFLMKGNNCYYGGGGQTSVYSNGVTFSFEKSSEDTNNTSVSGGQIPGFLFRKM